MYVQVPMIDGAAGGTLNRSVRPRILYGKRGTQAQRGTREKGSSVPSREPPVRAEVSVHAYKLHGIGPPPAKKDEKKTRLSRVMPAKTKPLPPYKIRMGPYKILALQILQTRRLFPLH